MQISEAFPSKYLKAADLQGRQVPVKMERVEWDTIGDDKKLILYFQGKEKGVVLNKTNANNISMAYGDDTDDWIGGKVILYEAMVDFQGKSVPAIRIKPAPREAAQARSPAAPSRHQPQRMAAAEADTTIQDDLDDTIPF